LHSMLANEQSWMNGARPSYDARRGAFDAARRRWPGLELTFEQFSHHLDRLGWGAALPRQIESLYLCAACSSGCNVACESLDREYFPVLRDTIQGRYRRRDFAEEVLQQTRERLLVGRAPRIATYRGDGSLASWLRRVANHLALDLHRSQRGHRLVDWHCVEALMSIEAFDAQAELTATSAWTRRLQHALTESVTALDTSHRQLLHLFHVQGINVDEISRCFGIDRATTYRRLHRTERLVRDGVLRAVRADTRHLNADDLQELLRRSCRELDLDGAWDARQRPTASAEALNSGSRRARRRKSSPSTPPLESSTGF
jgi:RNA polymerase sigma-70 factor (ECF subfamily)